MTQKTNEFIDKLLGDAAELPKLMRMKPEEYYHEMMKPRPAEIKNEVKRPDLPELLDEFGVSDKEFAEMALSMPSLWQPDELELFEAILSGEEVSRSLLSDLFGDVITGRRTIKTVKESSEPKLEESPLEEEKDPEELAEERAASRHTDMDTPPVPTMNTRLVDTTGWWKKP